MEAAEGTASAGQAEPSGRLRLNVPVAFGTLWVAPLLASFHARHPKVSLDVGFNDRLVDLIEEGWDLAVRIGVLRDSTLVSRKLTPCRAVLCAAPSYIERRGLPRTVAELARHACLGYTLSERIGADRWSFGADGAAQVRITGTLRTNNGDALRAAALSGLGVIYQPSFLVSDDLRAGRLVALALDHPPIGVGHIHVMFRPDRHLPPKSRAMIDFLAGQFGDPPPWDR